ncbi:MAG: histidine kinase [Panacagrimonas sp.]|nr:histidine kinase [Panacagrimonas sp.]
MVSVLGVAQLVFGIWNFRQLRSQHEEAIRAEMAAQPLEFDALLEQAGQSLGELGLQLASAYADVARAEGGAGLSRIETFGSIVSLEFFDGDGRSLGSWTVPGSEENPDIRGYAEAVARVRSHNRPDTLVDCRRECALFAFVPAFDSEGRKLVVAVGQPLSDTLVAFQRLGGTDAAVLRERRTLANSTATDTRLWGQTVLAVTNAPVLRPLLARLNAPEPSMGAIVPADAGERDLRLTRVRMPRTHDAATQLLFIVDETDALHQIFSQMRRSLVLNGVTLLISALAVYLLLRPALRRLREVTSALPLLAERQFEASRHQLRAHEPSRRSDEIGVLRDATLALSHRLQALDHAQAANEEKSRFLATMSHEIRTPMNGILGLLELIGDRNLTAEQRDAIRIARESGRTLLGVIDDILDFSRLEAGQIRIEQIRFRLADVVEDTVETLAPAARAKGLRLSVFVDPDLPDEVLGDPLRLRQILFNLCNNAIKFTQVGRVQVRAERLSATPVSQRVRLSVTDTGIGLPVDARDRLFRPFEQGDSTTTRRFGGTGLGLSIVHGLATRMGGTVDFSGSPGKGSNFWVDLELADAPPTEAASIPAPALAGCHVRVEIPDRSEAADLARYLLAVGADLDAHPSETVIREADMSELAHMMLEIHQGGRVVGTLPRPVRMRELVRRLRAAMGREPIEAEPVASPVVQARTDAPMVLVAEDHAVNQQVIERQLNLLGYRVTLAADGLEALERLKAQRFDLLIADLHMPRLDGLQLTRTVRAAEASDHGARRLPIIALTAAALSNEAVHCREAGMDGFLLKPVGLVQLGEVLANFVPLKTAPPPIATIGKAEHARPADAAIDDELLLDIVGQDPDYAAQLLGDFLRINEPLYERLAAMARDDFSDEQGAALAQPEDQRHGRGGARVVAGRARVRRGSGRDRIARAGLAGRPHRLVQRHDLVGPVALGQRLFEVTHDRRRKSVEPGFFRRPHDVLERRGMDVVGRLGAGVRTRRDHLGAHLGGGHEDRREAFERLGVDLERKAFGLAQRCAVQDRDVGAVVEIEQRQVERGGGPDLVAQVHRVATDHAQDRLVMREHRLAAGKQDRGLRRSDAAGVGHDRGVQVARPALAGTAVGLARLGRRAGGELDDRLALQQAARLVAEQQAAAGRVVQHRHGDGVARADRFGQRTGDGKALAAQRLGLGRIAVPHRDARPALAESARQRRAHASQSDHRHRGVGHRVSPVFVRPIAPIIPSQVPRGSRDAP